MHDIHIENLKTIKVYIYKVILRNFSKEITPTKSVVIHDSRLFPAKHLHHFAVQEKSLHQHPHKHSGVEVVKNQSHHRTN